MHIRQATSRDLHRLMEITITSLADDPAFDWMWPHRHEFPEDNFFFWQMRLQSLLCNKKSFFAVVALDAGDASPDVRMEVIPDTIISYGIWLRDGNSKLARERWRKKNTWLNILDALTTKIQQYSLSRKHQRRDADFARIEALDEAINEIDKSYYSDAPEKWIMELLVTDVKFRRRGAATALVRWGTQKADDEGVVCRVEASPMGRPVYKACGFVEVGPWLVRAKGQDEQLEIWVMRREAAKQP